MQWKGGLKNMLKISFHRTIMTDIIKDIYSDVSIGPVLGFKGGTALYFFYNLPRFSIDLDFDLLNESKKDIVFRQVTKIVKKYGELRQKRDKYFNLFWLLSYQKGLSQLKIEISKRSSENKYEVKNFFGIPGLVMNKEDMFANKLTALLNRKSLANRDIYDIWFMLHEHWDLNDKLLEFRTKIKTKLYLKKCLKLLENNPPTNILEGIGDLVDNKTKDWIKKNLIKDTIFLLKANFEI